MQDNQQPVISLQRENINHRINLIEWAVRGWTVLPAHKSPRAPASTLYAQVFPLKASPTIMKPWRTSIISYICTSDKRLTNTAQEQALCVWNQRSLSCTQTRQDKISGEYLHSTKADRSINSNQKEAILFWQFWLIQFKKSLPPRTALSPCQMSSFRVH